MQAGFVPKTPLLPEKTVFITGGSRGLGRALCDIFSREGASVAFNFSSDAEGAAATTACIEANGARALARQISVTDEAGLGQLVADIERTWGRIDILVNNAGMSQPLLLALLEERDWDAVMDVNAKGHYLATRAAIRGMIRRRAGVVLNMGSLAGMRLIDSPIHYAASKAAIKGFTEALAKEVGRYGIRVNCLAPGLLEEGVGSSLPQHRLEEYVAHVPLRRLGRLDEVARFAAFLVSDRNRYMHGATIVMDGGL